MLRRVWFHVVSHHLHRVKQHGVYVITDHEWSRQRSSRGHGLPHSPWLNSNHSEHKQWASNCTPKRNRQVCAETRWCGVVHSSIAGRLVIVFFQIKNTSFVFDYLNWFWSIRWIAWLRTAHASYIDVSSLLVSCIAVIVGFIPEGLPVCVTLALLVIGNIYHLILTLNMHHLSTHI